MADGLNFDFNSAEAAAAIGKSFTAAIQRKQEQALIKELEDRKKLAEEFERLAEDQALEEADRQQARIHALNLRLLPPGKNRPKEYAPDEKLKSQTGDPMGIPAMVPLLYKKVLKEGPKAPPRPAAIPPPPAAAAPGNPAAPGVLPPMPGFPGAGGPDSMLASAGAPPQPGGEVQGPNAISPAPAIPAPPSAEEPQFSSELKFRTAEQRAREEAELARIKNTVDFGGEQVDVRTLPAMGRQQTAAIAMRKLGLNPDGTPIPVEQLSAKERMQVDVLQSRMELMEAQEEVARATATGIPQKIQIAMEGLNIARQRVSVAEQKANAELALLGMSISGGPGQGIVGQPMGEVSAVDAWTELAQVSPEFFGKADSKMRTAVVVNMVRKGLIPMTEAGQKSLMHFNSARGAVDEIYNALEEYVQAEGVDALWAAHRLQGVVSASSRTVGKSLGELRMTDEDKKDFVKLLSPGIILSITNPERAKDWAKKVEKYVERLEKDNLQAVYQRVYARRSGELDTFKPGDTKNVTGTIDGSESSGVRPLVPPPPAVADTLPPVSQRVAGKTTATINGRKMVWYQNPNNPKDKGWEPAE